MTLWCYINDSSMFVMFFSHWSQRCSVNDEPSMKQWWITDENIATFTCSMTKLKAITLLILQMSSFTIKLFKKLSKLWFENQKSINSNLERKKFGEYSKNWFFYTLRNILDIFLRKSPLISSALVRISRSLDQKIVLSFLYCKYGPVI